VFYPAGCSPHTAKRLTRCNDYIQDSEHSSSSPFTTVDPQVLSPPLVLTLSSVSAIAVWEDSDQREGTLFSILSAFLRLSKSTCAVAARCSHRVAHRCTALSTPLGLPSQLYGPITSSPSTNLSHSLSRVQNARTPAENCQLRQKRAGSEGDRERCVSIHVRLLLCIGAPPSRPSLSSIRWSSHPISCSPRSPPRRCVYYFSIRHRSIIPLSRELHHHQTFTCTPSISPCCPSFPLSVAPRPRLDHLLNLHLPARMFSYSPSSPRIRSRPRSCAINVVSTSSPTSSLSILTRLRSCRRGGSPSAQVRPCLSCHLIVLTIPFAVHSKTQDKHV
jgi:hypothetical protein